MSKEVNLEGFQRDKYYARSWALLTMDKGWIKPVLILSLFQLIPIVGQLILLGYCVEWARLTAWGVNSAPKQSNISWGTCLSSGWRAFVVSLGWGAIAFLASMILAFIPLLGSLASFAIMLLIEVLVMVAVVRSAIYQEIGPGYKFKHIYEMVEHDLEGLFRIVGMRLIWNGIIGAIATAAILIPMGMALPAILELSNRISGNMDEAVALELAMQMIATILPAIIICALVAIPFVTVITMLSYTAVGLWYRQFNVPAWGRSDDPLPPFIEPTYTPVYQPNVYGNAGYDPNAQYAQNVYQPQTYDPAAYQAPAAAPVAQPAPAAAPVAQPAPTVAEPGVGGAEVVEVTPLTGAVSEVVAETAEAAAEAVSEAQTEAPAQE